MHAPHRKSSVRTWILKRNLTGGGSVVAQPGLASSHKWQHAMGPMNLMRLGLWGVKGGHGWAMCIWQWPVLIKLLADSTPQSQVAVQFLPRSDVFSTANSSLASFPWAYLRRVAWPPHKRYTPELHFQAVCRTLPGSLACMDPAHPIFSLSSV